MDKSASWNNEINVTNPNLFPQRSRRATQMRSRRLYITQPAEKTRASYLEGCGVASGKFSLTMRKPRKLNGICDRNSAKMNVSVWNVGCMIMKRHLKNEESNEQSTFLWFTIAGLKKNGEKPQSIPKSCFSQWSSKCSTQKCSQLIPGSFVNPKSRLNPGQLLETVPPKIFRRIHQLPSGKLT